MNSEKLPDDSMLRRYLLGDRMAEAEQERIEKAYFESDACFDRLLEAEDDLIDTYIRRGLPPEECSPFERHFLAAKRRRDRYEAMRAIAASFFRDVLRPRHSLLASFRDFFVMQSAATRAAMAAAAVAAVLSAGWLAAGYARLSRENANVRALLASSRPAPAPAFLTFTLRPGLLRSEAGAGSGNQIRVTPGVEWLVLRLQTPALHEYSWFASAVSTAAGEELLRQGRLVPAPDSLELRIPAGILTAGQDYVVSLTELQPGGQRTDLQSYALHVAR